MTEYFSNWNVVVDPEQFELASDGRRCQEATLLLVDEPCGAQTRLPVAITLVPGEARILARRLLAAAGHAERMIKP